ncbi:MAG TPA: substrate-binding domain-containing protein, partial [Ktedonobacterales bacterium]|nr:substrate-binding domain-containing protein [Ktedonobacterales bacterium]
QSGYACALRLFDLGPERRPTAIFAAADQMAYGVLRAAEERGLAVPRDVALVGYDDDAPSAHVLPPLTTVRQPSYEMGQEGIKLLLDLLAEAEAAEPGVDGEGARARMASARRVVLPTTLVVRASCGAVDPLSPAAVWETHKKAGVADRPDARGG